MYKKARLYKLTANCRSKMLELLSLILVMFLATAITAGTVANCNLGHLLDNYLFSIRGTMDLDRLQCD